MPRPLVVASTVMLAGTSSKKRGFLNAVLRRLALEAAPENATVPLRARDCVITGRASVVRFPEPVLPDFESDLVSYLCAQYGQASWFVETLLRDIGDTIDSLLLALMLPLPVAVRVNRLRTDVAGAEAALRAHGASILRSFGDILEIRVPGSIANCLPFRERAPHGRGRRRLRGRALRRGRSGGADPRSARGAAGSRPISRRSRAARPRSSPPT